MSDSGGASSRMFATIADRYDRINLVMSLGLLGRWRRVFFRRLQIEPGHRVVDVCAGTGWLTIPARGQACAGGEVLAVDLCPEMIRIGRSRAKTAGYSDIGWQQGDAVRLALDDCSCDRVMLGFALRNVPSQAAVLAEMVRVCRPGGRVGIIELSHPPGRLVAAGFRYYRTALLPLLDYLAVAPADRQLRPYRYLGRSLSRIPPANHLKEMLEQSGLEDVRFEYLAFGAVAVHTGTRPQSQAGGGMKP